MLFGKKKFNYIAMLILYLKLIPFVSIYTVALTFFNGFAPSFTIIVTARFLDNALAAVHDNSRLNAVWIPLILLIILTLYWQYTNIITNLVSVKSWEKMRKTIRPAILEKKAKLKFRYYENQESLDIMNRVLDNFENRVEDFYYYFSGVFEVVAQIIGFMIILSSQIWWASIIFVLGSVPSFVISYIFGKKEYSNEKELTKVDRKVSYYSNILTSRDTMEERYTYNYTYKINDKYITAFEQARISRKNMRKRWWLTNKLMSVITFFGGVLVIGILLQATIFPNDYGEVALSIGMFISLSGTVLDISSTMQGSISGYIKDFKYNQEYIADLNTFLAFEEEENAECLPDSKIPTVEKIELKNVSFKYPGTEKYILKNFNLELNTGKHYAIVGINGAGKTTLTKILTKLYDNYDGEVLINGRELREYSQTEVKALVSVIYQDFCRYPLDFYNNIAIGNILERENKARVENAVRTINLADMAEKLPLKYETPITKVKEDGIDLSGGEWQRIALARLIINSAPLKILDEPTAALDPISESHIYEQFGKIIANSQNDTRGITIFISHRLGSTKLADEIIVISNGRVAEHGTFDELIKLGGLYADMFESQAEWYQDNQLEKGQ